MAAMIDLTIAGRTYQVACREGEEENLQAAARLVDAKCREAHGRARHLVRIAPIPVRRAAARRPADRQASPTAAPPAAGPNPTDRWSNAPKRSPLSLEALAEALEGEARKRLNRTRRVLPGTRHENP